MKPKEPKEYELGFIDQDDLVDFVSEENEISDGERGTEPTQEGQLESSYPMPAEEEGDDLIPVLMEKKVKSALNEESVLTKRENTRGRLALIYTLATFLVFLVGIFVAVLDGLNREVSIIENLKEVVPLFSGVYLGTLGFVLGYYFKNDEN